MAKSLKIFLKRLYHFADYTPKCSFGKIDPSSFIPSSTEFSNPANLFIDEHVNIGEDAVLYSTNAKIVIKKYFVSARGLRIATGNHERRIGRFLSSISEQEKNHSIGLDQDVVINEDVWVGFGVTVLAGVEIGRGCTIASGSVVTRSMPPYCVCAGVPAKPIKFYWNIEQIMEHESLLYNEVERYTKDELMKIFKQFSC